ncbi:MAG TPA: DALR domain-containing protein, partial [Acidimicrobiales bacterium]|nr:DALR domain-containing protein [Acidimicrobiales bacterium]
GIDLAFPHHENERAQAVAAGRRFARHWVHNGHVTVGGEKMSKSLGNFTSLGDLLSRGDPRAFRLLVLQAHYRKPIEVTPETIAQASSGLERLDEMARRVGMPVDDAAGTVPPAVRPPEDGESGRLDSATMDHAAVARFRQRMDDDLDTPGAMAEVFELVREANSAADAGDAARAARSAETARSLCAAVGLRIGRRTDDVDQRTAELVRRRDEARAQGDWDRADSIRDELHAAGWVVEDGPRGTQVRRR